jgi:predicted 2-oxoglutarate/Fe(II)-dependent dioxygenase YbiX
MNKIIIDQVHIILNLFSPNDLLKIYKLLVEEKCNIDMNKNKYINIDNNSEISQLFYEKKIVLVKEIEKDFNVTLNPEELCNIVGYGKGWKLPEHIDNWDGTPTPALYKGRDISSSIYFTEEFLGGKLIFPKQKISIQPSAGSAVYFPSTSEYPHEVTEVIDGERWVSTCFWNINTQSKEN